MPSPKSSPKSSPQGSPKNSPKRSSRRKALQERSQNQSNRRSLRLVKDDDSSAGKVFSTTPFPTKPAHVLRPIVPRGQGSSYIGGDNVSDVELPGRLLEHVNKNKGKGRAFSNASSRPTTAETRTVSLTRSVAALRDHFESQASSPPAPLSPTLSARSPWDRSRGLETFFKTSSDEVILLGSDEISPFAPRQYKSEESLPTILSSPRVSRESARTRHSRPTTPELSSGQDSSSPNVALLGGTSSPNVETYDTSSDRESEAPEHDSQAEPSSPNVIRLSRPSSPFPRLVDVSSRSSTPNLIEIGASSSPNVVQIGGPSSPAHENAPNTSGSDESENSTGTVRKQHGAREQPSYATFPTSATRFSSSPPDRPLNTYASASSFELSEEETESILSGSAPSHRDLQAAIESSPAPNIQYPVIQAPPPSTYTAIDVPKRTSRPSEVSSSDGEWNPYLSTIPSEWSAERRLSRPLSNTRQSPPFMDGADERPPERPIERPLPEVPRAAFVRGRDVTGSTIRRVSEDDHHGEGDDYLSDLRTSSLHAKASGFLSIISSNTDSRHNSIRSSLRRPSSNNSLRTSLPTWARRYYSLGGSQLAVNIFGRRGSWQSIQAEFAQSFSPSLTSSTSPPVTEHLQSFISRPRTRPRPITTQTALEPGYGPLTSHPTPRPDDEMEETIQEARQARDRKPRPKSLPLDFADPRNHWAQAEETAFEREQRELEAYLRQSRIAQDWSPHLFHDARVEKGGHGHRRWWKAPSLKDRDANDGPFEKRSVQVWAFSIGFVIPLAWFVAAFLPLPVKPSISLGTEEDERRRTKGKQRRDSANLPEMVERRSSNFRLSRQDLESQIRVEQKLAMADEIRHENARWWRNLNRFMCAVGIVIIALVVCSAVS